MKKGGLAILTYNEIEGSKKLYNDLPINQFHQVIVVDGGSDDGTVEFWKNKGVDVYIQKIKGRGTAFNLAMQVIDTDYVIFFSPDGNEDPRDILKIASMLEKGYDLVIATRFGKGGKSEDAGFIRGFGNRAFTTIANVLFRTKVTDAINGFRGIWIKSYEQLGLPNSRFEIEYQMTIRAGKLGMKIFEIPTFEGNRIGGYSKAGTIKVGLSFVRLIIKELLIRKKFRPGIPYVEYEKV